MKRLFCLIFLILTAAAFAEEGARPILPVSPDSIDQETAELSEFSAPVKVDGIVLFHVRGIKSYPAERRAREIRDRIIGLARDPAFRSDSLVVVEKDESTEIFAGDLRVIAVLDADARTEGLERQILAKAFVRQIAEAIERYRYDRRPDILRHNAVYALVVTVIGFSAFFLLRWLRRKIGAAIKQRFTRRVGGLKVGSFEIVQAERMERLLTAGLQTLRLLAILALLYAYFAFVLVRFPRTRAFALGLIDLVIRPLRTMGHALVDYLPSLAFLVVLVVVIRYLLKMVNLFFKGIEGGTVTLSGFDRDWARPTYRIVRFIVIAFAVVVAYPYIPGSESDAFKGVSLFVGVLLSLGSSSAMSNIIAGYMMIYRRTFKVGDRVQIGEFRGDVVEMRLLVTHLRTIKNEVVVVPNSLILNGNVVNYSMLAKTRGLILHTTVGVGYNAPWRQVEAMLRLAAERTPGLLREPPPFVLQKALDDFAVKYEINAYCDDPHAMARLYTDLHRNILDLFNEHGVQIMTPAYEGDPEAPKVVPKEKWYAAPADSATGEKKAVF